MSEKIHPTACIAEDVKLGKNVVIGPFAVIEGQVEIGDNCQLGAHSVIQSHVRMGHSNILHPHAVLGGLPQDISFNVETTTWLEIGDGNEFREGFTAHRATLEDQVTRIGSGCYFMNNSHVAHDCQIGNNTIFASNVAIGGFVQVGKNVFMGGASMVHQFCRIGDFSIVQGTTGLNKDVIPFTLIGGRPAKHYRLNTIGLKRAGISGARYKVLSSAFRLLRQKKSLDELEATEEMALLIDWLNTESKRGIHGFVEI